MGLVGRRPIIAIEDSDSSDTGDSATMATTKSRDRTDEERSRTLAKIQLHDLGDLTFNHITTVDIEKRPKYVNINELHKKRECNIAGSEAAAQAKQNETKVQSWSNFYEDNKTTDPDADLWEDIAGGNSHRAALVERVLQEKLTHRMHMHMHKPSHGLTRMRARRPSFSKGATQRGPSPGKPKTAAQRVASPPKLKGNARNALSPTKVKGTAQHGPIPTKPKASNVGGPSAQQTGAVKRGLTAVHQAQAILHHNVNTLPKVNAPQKIDQRPGVGLDPAKDSNNPHEPSSQRIRSGRTGASGRSRRGGQFAHPPAVSRKTNVKPNSSKKVVEQAPILLPGLAGWTEADLATLNKVPAHHLRAASTPDHSPATASTVTNSPPDLTNPFDPKEDQTKKNLVRQYGYVNLASPAEFLACANKIFPNLRRSADANTTTPPAAITTSAITTSAITTSAITTSAESLIPPKSESTVPPRSKSPTPSTSSSSSSSSSSSTSSASSDSTIKAPSAPTPTPVTATPPVLSIMSRRHMLRNLEKMSVDEHPLSHSNEAVVASGDTSPTGVAHTVERMTTSRVDASKARAEKNIDKKKSGEVAFEHDGNHLIYEGRRYVLVPDGDNPYEGLDTGARDQITKDQTPIHPNTIESIVALLSEDLINNLNFRKHIKQGVEKYVYEAVDSSAGSSQATEADDESETAGSTKRSTVIKSTKSKKDIMHKTEAKTETPETTEPFHVRRGRSMTKTADLAPFAIPSRAKPPVKVPSGLLTTTTAETAHMTYPENPFKPRKHTEGLMSSSAGNVMATAQNKTPSISSFLTENTKTKNTSPQAVSSKLTGSLFKAGQDLGASKYATKEPTKKSRGFWAEMEESDSEL